MSSLHVPDQPAYSRRPSAQGIAAWVDEHADPIAEYNAWAEQREPYSQRVRRWRHDGR